MGRNGQFYYGKSGFSFKRSSGGGTHRTFPLGLITGTPADVFNKYVSGAGVGAQSTAVRRSKLRSATICNQQQPCGRFILRLGQHPTGSLSANA
jgi:hypothetical protein